MEAQAPQRARDGIEVEFDLRKEARSVAFTGSWGLIVADAR